MSTAANQVIEFVRALALGWKNLAAYPPGHPVLVSSLDLIQRRLGELRGPAGDIALGIARDGVLYGQEKIDSSYAQKFGNALYTRGVAVLRFDTETTVEDIEIFLRMLGTAESKRPIWEELTAAGVMSINLQPVDYSDVKVSDALDEQRPKSEPENLWDQILRAIVAGKEFTPEGRRLLAYNVRSASELATLILQYTNSIEQPAQYDPDATFGVKFTYRVDGGGAAEDVGERMADAIGAFITASVGAKRDIAVQQAIELLKSLPESMRGAVMRSVLRAISGDESAGALLRRFTESLPKDEVLEGLRSLSATMALSSHAVRLVESLMSISKDVEPAAVPSASVVSDLVHLFGEEDIDRFNPEDHSQLLDQVSVQIPEPQPGSVRPISDLGDRLNTIAPDAVSDQLAKTLLDLVRAQGQRRPPWAVLKRIEDLFRADIAEGRFDQAVQIVRDLQEIAIVTPNAALQDAIHDTFDHIGTAETVRVLIDTLHGSPQGQTHALEELLLVLGSAATRNLIHMLAEETNRSRRRRLFDFVASLGTVIIPEIKPFLSDPRWFVVRNMIALLRTVSDRTLLTDVRRCANHPDIRVRLEAIKTLIELDPSPPKNLLEDAIRDPDPKIAEKAITLAGSYGIKEAVDPLLQVIDGNDVWGAKRPLRLRALRALGELAEPKALLHLQRFFTDSFLPWPAKEERRVAYESLAGYPPSARAPIVEKGLRSRDPYVREICARIANG